MTLVVVLVVVAVSITLGIVVGIDILKVRTSIATVCSPSASSTYTLSVHAQAVFCKPAVVSAIGAKPDMHMPCRLSPKML